MAIECERTPRVCECGDHAFVRLTRHGVALASPEDCEMLKGSTWYQTVKGYAESRGGKLHRLVLNAPDGLIVDHINHDKLDCRRENLRLADNFQSVRNRKKLRRNGHPASRYIGVHRNGCGWIARIVMNGTRKSVGTYPTQEEAAMAYDRAAKSYVGEFARLNFGS